MFSDSPESHTPFPTRPPILSQASRSFPLLPQRPWHRGPRTLREEGEYAERYGVRDRRTRPWEWKFGLGPCCCAPALFFRSHLLCLFFLSPLSACSFLFLPFSLPSSCLPFPTEHSLFLSFPFIPLLFIHISFLCFPPFPLKLILSSRAIPYARHPYFRPRFPGKPTDKCAGVGATSRPSTEDHQTPRPPFAAGVLLPVSC